MEYDIIFTVTGPLEVEETFSNRAILSGTFLKLEKVTKNKREYRFEEGAEIAKALEGMPVYFGVDPITNKHLKGALHKVGKVIRSIFDKAKKTIRGWVEVWNTEQYPDVANRVSKGWGYSIGGKAKGFELKFGKVKTAVGNLIMRIFGMMPNHLQLLEPEVTRGQEEAKVSTVKGVEETLSLDPCPWGLCEVPQESVVEPTDGTSPEVPPAEEPEVPSKEPEVPVIPPPRPVVVRTVIKRFISVDDPDSSVVTR